MTEHLVGAVGHHYDKPKVAGLELSDKLDVGDKVHFLGHTSDFTQIVVSIPVEHEPVASVRPGEPIGIKVSERTPARDEVLVVTPDELECV
jgi:hypothetical protein